MQVILDQQAIEATLQEIASAIAAEVAGGENLALIGIRSRGEILARRLATVLSRKIGGAVDLGTVDITLYRDDLDRKGVDQPHVRATEIPFELNDHHVVLVDDVLWTGRTVRAALDALTDFGRPGRIRLAVLVDRGGRELPIQADIVGRTIPSPGEQKVQVLLSEIDGEDAVKLV